MPGRSSCSRRRARISGTPFRGAGPLPLSTGGRRYAATPGYHLATLWVVPLTPCNRRNSYVNYSPWKSTLKPLLGRASRKSLPRSAVSLGVRQESNHVLEGPAGRRFSCCTIVSISMHDCGPLPGTTGVWTFASRPDCPRSPRGKRAADQPRVAPWESRPCLALAPCKGAGYPSRRSQRCHSMSVRFQTEATAPALAGRFRIARWFSQGGCPGLMCPHAVGVQNVQTSVAAFPPTESDEARELTGRDAQMVHSSLVNKCARHSFAV